jgi:hypothetical protein
MKQPYLPLYTGDWKKDPELSSCSPATRGVWIDLLCTMHDSCAATLTGTPDKLSRLARCSASEMQLALIELRDSRSALVHDHDGVFTITCRRLLRKQEVSKIRSESGSKGASKRLANREQIPEYENEDEGLEKVRGFARGEGIPLADAEWFFWKCHANGWTNGGRPILDWKATVRCWWRAGWFPSQRQHRWNGEKPPPPRSKKEIELDQMIATAKKQIALEKTQK